MKEIPKISEAEWEVMRVLWEQYPRTANQIVEKLEGPMDWSPKTIRSLLNRLVQKKAIDYKPNNRNYEYFPLVTNEECTKQETVSFLKRIAGTGLKPWFVHFLKDEKLSHQEIEELKKILDEKQPD